MKTLVAWMALALVVSGEELAKGEKFLSNGEVKIGVDLSSGGSVFWFSELPGDRNLLNHYDRGRFIQQSYYGKSDGSKWGEQPWRWNPVQGGDFKGKPARVLENRDEGGGLYVKSVPVNWAGGQDVEDCRMEEWIKLEGKVATIRFRFTYSGSEEHPPAHQELPAVFIDHAFADLACYSGEKPWTGEALSVRQPGWPNESCKATEEWAAYLGADGRGVGVYFPGSSELTCYRFAGADGPKGAGCSYFAPVRTMQIKPGFVHDYTIHLSIGTAKEVRERFDGIRKKR
ncbi:hypothetical protein [Luteolibacter soli]|uniref:Uncharacterized protein n=1 Tax=Luteolibacter soli TaxID=3135280 RepID=A0ABU9AU60_9BACT